MNRELHKSSLYLTLKSHLCRTFIYTSSSKTIIAYVSKTQNDLFEGSLGRNLYPQVQHAVPQLEYSLASLAAESDVEQPSVMYRLAERPQTGDRTADPCPTLRRCLGHRACAFLFSNEFCGRDPHPGRRKVRSSTAGCCSVGDLHEFLDFGGLLE